MRRQGMDPLPWIVWIILGFLAIAAAWFWGVWWNNAGVRRRDFCLAVVASAVFLIGEVAWTAFGKLDANYQTFPKFADYQAAWAFLDRATAQRRADRLRGDESSLLPDGGRFPQRGFIREHR